MCIYIYIYIYIRLGKQSKTPRSTTSRAVGFHNFNLRIFNLRVSNPNKSIVDVFLTRCRISMRQGLGPEKHDEISEIDRSRTPYSFELVYVPPEIRPILLLTLHPTKIA